jgi:hypothetical protein
VQLAANFGIGTLAGNPTDVSPLVEHYLAEGVHPVARLLKGADTALTELLQLIQTRQLDLELQGRPE